MKDLNYFYARAKIASDNLKKEKDEKNKEPEKPMKDIAKKWYLTILVFLVVLGLTLHTNTSYDAWWHYKLGEYIVKNKEIPNTAIFSWYGLENNLTWISHEWLFAVIVYGISKLFGFAFIPIFVAFVTSLLIALIVYCNFENIKNSPLKIVLLVILCGMLLINATVGRPQVFLNWLLVGLYAILRHEIEKKDKLIFLIVPLTILWANIHGGSWILIPFFALLFFICDVFVTKEVEKKTTIKRVLALILSISAIFINPHGLQMYLYPFTNASDTTMLAYITEWQQLNLRSWTNLIFLILPVIYIFPVIFNKRTKDDVYDLLVFFALLAMTLISVRFSTQLTIMCFYLITKNNEFKEEKHKEKSYKIIIQILIIYLAYTGGINIKNTYENPYNLSMMPTEEIIETIKTSNVDRLYNPYDVGGYLIYNDIDTFIDGRADIYSRNNFKDYAGITICEYEFEEKLDKYDFDGFLVQKTENLYKYLSENNDFKKINEDDNFAFFVTKTNTKVCNTKGC